QGGQEQLVTKNRQPAREPAAAVASGGIRLVHISPDRLTGGRIQSDNVIRTLNGVHDAVHHERCHFLLFERTRLEDPLEFEIPHVLWSDLGELAVPLACQRTSVGQPVVGFLICFQEPLEWHVCNGRLTVLRSLRSLSEHGRSREKCSDEDEE